MYILWCLHCECSCRIWSLCILFLWSHKTLVHHQCFRASATDILVSSCLKFMPSWIAPFPLVDTDRDNSLEQTWAKKDNSICRFWRKLRYIDRLLWHFLSHYFPSKKLLQYLAFWIHDPISINIKVLLVTSSHLEDVFQTSDSLEIRLGSYCINVRLIMPKTKSNPLWILVPILSRVEFEEKENIKDIWLLIQD